MCIFKLGRGVRLSEGEVDGPSSLAELDGLPNLLVRGRDEIVFLSSLDDDGVVKGGNRHVGPALVLVVFHVLLGEQAIVAIMARRVSRGVELLATQCRRGGSHCKHQLLAVFDSAGVSLLELLVLVRVLCA